VSLRDLHLQKITKKIKKQKDGTIFFDDAKTGSKVTLQNSEVKEISNKEYKEAVKKEKK